MTTRLVILAALTIAAIAVAYLLQRRRPEPPSSPSYRSISEIDRSEFAHPDASILIVMFGSTTCNTCPVVWETIESLGVPAERVDVQDDPVRHKRYRIDGVPTTIVVNAAGIVGRTFFGPLTAEDLRAEL